MCKKFLKRRKDIKTCRIKKRQAGFFRLSSAILAVLILFIVGGVYYLGLVNNRATLGYKITDLERKVSNLKELNQKLDLELIDLKQISRLQTEAERLKMVVSENITYLEQEDGLAVR